MKIDLPSDPVMRMTLLDRIGIKLGRRIDSHLLGRMWGQWIDRPVSTEQAMLYIDQLRALVKKLQEGVARPKGSPDYAQIYTKLLNELEPLVNARDFDERGVALAHALAQLEVGRTASAMLFLHFFEGLNRHVLDELRGLLSSRVVLHMSCIARLQRAEESVLSFSAAEPTVSQLTIVGGARGWRYEWDGTHRVLTVPASDAYEGLPQKIAAALRILAHLPQVKAVLKVDDDLRLGTLGALDSVFRVAEQTGKGQLGHVIRTKFEGDHSRAWHFEKCSDTVLNGRAFHHFTGSRWCDGALGYLVSQKGLRAVAWAALYFDGEIQSALYEDVMMSNIMQRLGGGLGQLGMGGATATIATF